MKNFKSKNKGKNIWNIKINRKKKKFKKQKYKKMKIKNEDIFIKRNFLNHKIIPFIFIILLLFLLGIIFLIFYHKRKSSLNKEIMKIINKDYKVNDNTDESTYFKIIQEFIELNYNETLVYDYKNFEKNENPKISIITTIHNGESFIKALIRNIQNQDFHDIEIIIVEDDSKDGSVKIIKELMKEDPRIILIENNGNKGYLTSVVNGGLKIKGKYVTTIDVDDLFSVENTLSIIYEEIEKNNVDMLGFTSTQGILDMSNYKFTHSSFHNYFETPIIYQPEIKEEVFMKNDKGEINGLRDVVWGYIYKAEFFIKAINKIDEKYLNIIMNLIGDYLLYFILTKTARTLKYIKKILHVNVQKKYSDKAAVKFFNEEKEIVRSRTVCRSYLNYIEFTFAKSDNNLKLASFALNDLYLNNKCKEQTNIRNEGIRICKLFLQNQYVENKIKDLINLFLNQINQ